MKALLVSADGEAQELMALTALGVRRALGQDAPVELAVAPNGRAGVHAAWRMRPDVVIAEEITSPAGAFSLTKELRDSDPAFSGAIVILLERPEDAWLAGWAGADAWLVKPVDPFELGDTIARLLADRVADVRKEAG